MESSASQPAPAILPDLIHCVRTAFREHGRTPRVGPEVAAAIQPFLGHPRLLAPEHCQPDPDRYCQHLLHAEEDGTFSIVALVWRPGQATAVHDHLSWCVIGVHQGVEQEVQFQLVEAAGGAFLLPVDSAIHPTGAAVSLTPPGDIHYVVNPGPGLAISLHVYGLDVRRHGSSIRRRYDLPIRLPATGLAEPLHSTASPECAKMAAQWRNL
ncbi:MAG TPA: cysteine dioxygenase family protein [Thermoanaerobaculia bacterium]|nr:cysteine dioxygenase family protein [Thermoanaerobaculia bacterium]